MRVPLLYVPLFGTFYVPLAQKGARTPILRTPSPNPDLRTPPDRLFRRFAYPPRPFFDRLKNHARTPPDRTPRKNPVFRTPPDRI